MKRPSYHITRVGLSITFMWIGVLILRSPEAWGSFLQPWALKLLPVPLVQAMIATAILDILVGVSLLFDLFVWVVALLGALHIFIVLVTTGISDITIRDIGLFTASVALSFDSLPPWVIARFLKPRVGGNGIRGGLANNV